MLWPWPFTFDLEHIQCIACDVMKFCATFERNRAIRYCDFNIWPNDLERRVTCWARLWDISHQVWPSTTFPCLNYIVFMLIRRVTLWPWSLTRWPWKFIVHQALRDQSLYEIWAKSCGLRLNYWQFCEFLHTLCHAVTLTFDRLTLNFYTTSGVMCINNNRPLKKFTPAQSTNSRGSGRSRSVALKKMLTWLTISVWVKLWFAELCVKSQSPPRYRRQTDGLAMTYL